MGPRTDAGGRDRARMRSLRALVSAMVCGLSIASSGCTPVQTAVTVPPGASFALAPGQTAAVNGTGTRITFNQVREDSRCPVDVTCVWEGDAKIEIVISREGSADDKRVLSIRPPSNEAQSGRLKIRFVGLSPVPRHADGNRPRNYLAEFVADTL
jgi:hypothetical protein